MNEVLALTLHHLRTQRQALVVALLLGLVTLTVPLVPGVAKGSPAEVREGTALVLAGCYAIALAAFGGAALAEDAGSGRLGFWMTQPLGAGALASARLLAGLASALGAALLVLLPTGLVGAVSGHPLTRWVPPIFGVGLADTLDRPLSPVTFALGLAVVVLAVYLIAVALRSHSRTAILDLAGALATAGLLTVALRTVRSLGALWIGAGGSFVAGRELVLFVATAVALPLLAVAAWRGLSGGRSLIVRVHAAQSRTLWSLAVPLAATAALGAAWMARPQLADLEHVTRVEVAPAGAWVSLEGLVRRALDYPVTFLVDTRSGRAVWTRSRTARWDQPGVVFSGDGRVAAWFENGPSPAIVTMALGEPGSSPRRTSLVHERVQAMALSNDGTLLAVRESRRLVLEDLVRERILGAWASPHDGRLTVEGGAAVLRELATGSGVAALRITRYAPRAAPAVVATPSFALDGESAWWNGFIRSGELVVRVESLPPSGAPATPSSLRAVVLDAASGAVRFAVPVGDDSTQLGILADGGLAALDGARDRGRSAELRTFAADGSPRLVRPLSGRRAELAGELAPGILGVIVYRRAEAGAAEDRRAAGPASGSRSFGELVAVDLATGAVRRVGPDLYPAARGAYPEWGSDTPPRPGLVWRDAGRGSWELCELDSATFALRRVLAVDESRFGS